MNDGVARIWVNACTPAISLQFIDAVEQRIAMLFQAG